MKQKRLFNIKSKRLLSAIRIACLTGALAAYGTGAYADVMSNTALPSGGTLVGGNANIGNIQNNILSITNINNAVIKWESFDIGSIATVNFKGKNNFNILNYVNSGKMSQIHGTMNAQGGNVYLVNTAGVFIGKSAQIDVGSLHISNRKIDLLDVEKPDLGNNPNINDLFNNAAPASAAELMSLGNINANSVTFDGDRIVLDTAKLTTSGSANPMAAGNITIKTTDADNVVLGYDGYDEKTEKYLGESDEKHFNITTVKYTDDNGTITNTANVKGYMWVEDVEQLQAIRTNLSGNYALRNGIDATNTAEISFESIGDEKNPFTGKLDGLAGRVDGVDFAIFDLHVAGEKNVGLFGVTQNATIKNLLLTSGEVRGTGDNIGAVTGQATNTVIENIRSSVNVTGAIADDKGNITGSTSSNVGGIIGKASNNTSITNAFNAGAVSGHKNVGGIVGSLEGGELSSSRNLGAVKGINNDNTDDTSTETSKYSHNVGGLTGSASNAQLTGLQNDLNVTGGYNVGGIAGSIDGTTVQNAANSGNITADGYTEDTYNYHTNNSDIANDKSVNENKNAIANITVFVANAGGIVGSASAGNSSNEGDNTTSGDSSKKPSSITDATNTGDVKTTTQKATGNDYEYHIAGNVGGIVGRAENTDIANAENKENAVFGAHNVGGIAGLFTADTESPAENNNAKTYTISNAVNNGGEIKATGARGANNNASNAEDDFVKESVRANTKYSSDESVIVGNIGGIAGYMYGDNVKITGSGNRGTVHSADVGDNVLPINQAANVGGIAGKIDRNESKTIDALQGTDSETIKENIENAAVSNSYNTGNVRGYTGVGGIAGMMYNGEIAASYNLGDLRSTFKGNGFAALNMGGIVGDTTEDTNAEVLLYDVYNKGKIGDETFTYYGRHVGGIVGRLSGDIEKAYNTGEIYNASVADGGIVGWWYNGNINNVFNTGNITVVNKTFESEMVGSRVGGLFGAASPKNNLTLSNAYNLGTLRSFNYKFDDNKKSINIIGLIGGIIGSDKDKDDHTNLTIQNVYTTGNFAAYDTDDNKFYKLVKDISDNNKMGLVAKGWNKTGSKSDNIVYIFPSNKDLFYVKDEKSGFEYADISIKYGEQFNQKSYNKNNAQIFNFDNTSYTNNTWRIYDGKTTPILNAFLPSIQEKENDLNLTNGATVQYGTAYNPLLTIVTLNNNDNNTSNNLSLDWKKAGIKQNEGLAVYGGGLEITNFVNATNSGYYGGLIYADGALTISGQGINNDGSTANNILFGSAAEIYGSSVNITSGGDLISYGSITATGKEGSSDVNLNGSNVEIIGKVTSLDPTTIKDDTIITIPGIGGTPATTVNYQDSNDPNKAMPDTAEKYAYPVTKGSNSASGNITITATAADGKAEVLLGNEKSGFIDSAGNITIKGSEVYVDSDLNLGGSLILDAAESVLDLSNIGAADDPDKEEKRTLVDFLGHFAKKDGDNTNKNKISFVNKPAADGSDNIGVNNAKITLDLWDEAHGNFNMGKYDKKDNGTTGKLTDALNKLQVEYKTPDDTDVNNSVSKLAYIWISDAEQLAGIQEYYESPDNSNSHILSYNFALKNNIDATTLQDYRAIGRATNDSSSENEVTSYNGIFDGRGNSIIGLNVTGGYKNEGNKIGRQSGIFAQVGADGSVKNLNVIAGNFEGGSTGAVAGVNKGTIENITTFGNRISSNGYVENDTLVNGGKVGAAGGIAGINTGTIKNVTLNDAAIAGVTAEDTSSGQGNVAIGNVDSTAGGIAGINTGTIESSAANSAVTASAGNANALGGVAGINYGKNAELDVVESLGIVNGNYKGIKAGEDGTDESNPVTEIRSTENIGGIAGVNYNGAEIRNAYNEAHLTGSNGVGGIVGNSSSAADNKSKNTIENAVNAGTVISSSEGLKDNKTRAKNAGGLVGNSLNTEIKNARNVGAVNGENNVGGLVGVNGAGSSLENAINDGTATITGIRNVGGIAGINESTITAPDKNSTEASLSNKGAIYGVEYVGGIAGANYGTINNAVSDITLHINEAALKELKGKNPDAKAQYFGGTAGINGSLGQNKKAGTITNAINNGAVIAHAAEYVGGIVGHNTENGSITGAGNSNTGKVTGASYVGGVVGLNDGQVSGTNGAITKITNEGLVIAESGGAGGLIGVNNAAISNSQLINSGVVLGTKYSGTDSALSGTGGVIGVNNANASITDSDLINTLDGAVISSENAGGVIGLNKARVSGGRDAGNNYYAHQVYNNGTVIGGTWSNAQGNKIITANNSEIIHYTVSSNSQNTGGLIGTNAQGGSLTAAYNTGAVSGGKNVGGVAGSNAGTIDQVFNTVSVWDENECKFIAGAVSGTSNVGGVVGDNSGTISNAYNTSAVAGDTNAGSITGSNSGAVSNVYSTTDLQLTGACNGSFSSAYSSSSADDGKNGITVLSADELKTLGKYSKNFVTAASGSTGESIWKFYNGFTEPLLRVFLTKAAYNGTIPENKDGLKVTIDNNTVVLSDASGKTLGTVIVGNNAAAHSLMDFINSYNADPAKENLIVFNGNAAGAVYEMFYSYQIRNGKDRNPNNLGYDFVPLTYDKNGNPIPDTRPLPPDYAEEFFWQAEDKYPWYQWDKQRNERERKAEINFVKGGMKI